MSERRSKGKEVGSTSYGLDQEVVKPTVELPSHVMKVDGADFRVLMIDSGQPGLIRTSCPFLFATPESEGPTSDGSGQEVNEPPVELPGNDTYSPQLKIHCAALRGDWNAAEAMRLANGEDILKEKITCGGDTPLHIAAGAKQTAFVHKLVQKLSREDLELTNDFGDTAFCIAAVSGVVEIVNVMYEKNTTLPTIQGQHGRLSPIEQAALFGNKAMVEYLVEKSFRNFNRKTRMRILVTIIGKGMYDIALKLLSEDRLIAASPIEEKASALNALARSSLSLHYVTGQDSQERICERLFRIFHFVPCFRRIYDSIQMRRHASQLVKEICKQIRSLNNLEIVGLFDKTNVLQYAAKTGNVEFLTLLINSYPDIIWTLDRHFHTIFHIAVIYRQERVFSLQNSIGALRNYLCLRPNFGNMLYLATELAPSGRLNSVSGAALQMQRELLWFREVEKMHPELSHDKRYFSKQTPRELFMEKHEQLRVVGERWMKDTATSCMVVATLIATVVFAAIFTIPGGNREETGRPIFLIDNWFTIFVMFDAVAMFSSTTSILMFLSILTSRYGVEDFLFKLPAKFMIGLITLFASVACMVLTFSATFFLVYKDEKENRGTIPKIVVGLALFPITLYAVLNCRLWVSLIHSTIWASRFMFKSGKHGLSYQNEQGSP